MTEEPTDAQKHTISLIIAVPGAIMIATSLKPEIISAIVGVIGIFLLAFGAICEGSVKK